MCVDMCTAIQPFPSSHSTGRCTERARAHTARLTLCTALLSRITLMHHTIQATSHPHPKTPHQQHHPTRALSSTPNGELEAAAPP